VINFGWHRIFGPHYTPDGKENNCFLIEYAHDVISIYFILKIGLVKYRQLNFKFEHQIMLSHYPSPLSRSAQKIINYRNT
jgi:hypothetical protein